MNPTFVYQIENGSYCWYNGSEERQGMSDEVAVVFDDGPGSCILLKHGPPELVTKWMVDTMEQYERGGVSEFTRYWKLASGKLDVDELNQAISTAGYRPVFLPAKEEPIYPDWVYQLAAHYARNHDKECGKDAVEKEARLHEMRLKLIWDTRTESKKYWETIR